MKKFAILCAAVGALSIATPGMAQTASPLSSTHTFGGNLDVMKNVGSYSTCTMSLTVAVSATGVASVPSSPTIGGGGPCPVITITGLPTNLAFAAGSGSKTVVTTTPVKINIGPYLIFPADACEAVLRVTWGGNSATPRTISFSTPLSDMTDANPDNFGGTENVCKMRGTLTETTSPALNLN